MGNGVGKLTFCFSGDSGGVSRRHHHDIAVFLSNPLDEGLGHSFCYIRPHPFLLSSDDCNTTTFRSISGASISANTSTALSTSTVDLSPYLEKASAFESSSSFASIPLQPIPRNSIPAINSGPVYRYSGAVPGSGPLEKGFLSGPIERGFISGPLENQFDQFQRYRTKTKKWVFNRFLNKIMGKSIVVPICGTKEFDWGHGLEKNNEHSIDSNNTMSGQVSLDDDDDHESIENENLQWAQGKAGEDRVHVVVSEENGWVFVGIYDGFNGPDATDFLLNNLYSNVHKELEGLQWNDKFESIPNSKFPQTEDFPSSIADLDLDMDLECNSTKKTKNLKNRTRGVGKNWQESQRKWRCEWDRERVELDRKLKEQLQKPGSNGANRSDVLKALSEGLRKTEKSFLEIADLMLKENPELSLMGSCVLVMLMKGEDVYVMNVGDSRAVLARKAEPDLRIGKASHDLERIKEETLNDLEAFDGDEFDGFSKLTALQLTKDHSTSVEEEVRRIKNEHRDDASAISNDRVKGSLKVTRAFGAGFLKKPKWNNALLEIFRIDYTGVAPYINCTPSLHHHRLSPKDKFLILSSDGLYQYFTNEEAVSEVQRFIEAFPEGDPAQHLVEQVVFRAAKKAGMDFYELLDIPQGDRRRYHDDVSITIISFEGRIWRSSM